jgi:HNH endonuclease
MFTCVYCRRSLERADFNREHVIPDQLGSFAKNLFLYKEVCKYCNQYFGDTIELAFGRESAEAVFRLMHGQKDPKSVKPFSGERVYLRLPSGTPCPGAILIVRPSPDGTCTVVDLPPQIGMGAELGENLKYVTEEELRRDEDLRLQLASFARFHFLAPDEVSRERLIELVRESVQRLRIHEEFSLAPHLDIRDEKVRIEVVATIDRTVAKAVSKIVLNYLTYHLGPQFVLDLSLDKIRRFIRFDEGDWREFVKVSSTPILAEETESVRVTRAHLMTIEWQGPWTLVGSFAPYNWFTYGITLTQRYRGLWIPIRIGNAFDWENHEILGMAAWSGPTARNPKGAARAYEALRGSRLPDEP